MGKKNREDREKDLVEERLRRKNIRRITNGVLGTLVDVTLFSLFFPFSTVGKGYTSRCIYQAARETNEVLSQFNYQLIKRSLNKLHEEGLIESIKDWVNEPILTQAGIERLRRVLPQYDKKRLWSGKLYLINYDISSKNNRQRNLLRRLLLKLGAIKLQDSLYLTCNNPDIFIEEFKKEYSFSGTILVSELSKRNFIGEEDLKTFIWRMAKLDLINGRYEAFIDKRMNQKKNVNETEIAFEYYAILKDDPQLPFEILADDYLGDEAYLLFRRLVKKSP